MATATQNGTGTLNGHSTDEPENPLRDLRSGKVGGQEGETVRTCINTAEGPVEIEL